LSMEKIKKDVWKSKPFPSRWGGVSFWTIREAVGERDVGEGRRDGEGKIAPSEGRRGGVIRDEGEEEGKSLRKIG